MSTIHPGLALVEDAKPTESLTAVEWSIRVILILGFAVVLALEAYLIWEAILML